jgi:hypothetical protein
MKKLAAVGALVLVGLMGCSDTVTRRTTTYQETASNLPSTTVVTPVTPGTTVITPGTVVNDDGTTTTTTKTTKRVERYETN